MALPGAAALISPAAVPLGLTQWALGAGSVCSQAPFNLAYTLYISHSLHAEETMQAAAVFPSLPGVLLRAGLQD